jgi:predicted DNA-binding transcriptional regulator AlpA
MTSAWLTAQEVASAIHRSRPGVYQLLKSDPTFPQPIRPYGGPRSHPRWWRHEVEAWKQRFAPALAPAQEDATAC